MSLPTGRSVSLSPGRRFVIDVMHFSQGVPLVTVERRVNLAEVAAARIAGEPRIGWFAIFLKAFALAAREHPDLRRSFLTIPYRRLHEHAASVACVTVEREHEGEAAVFVIQIREPDLLPLARIAHQLHRAKTAPIREVSEFRRIVRLAKLPLPLRRLAWWLTLRAIPRWREKYIGTFVASSTVSAGGEVVSALTPLTTYFTVGPVSETGEATLRLMFDHRVTDAAPMARALAAVERALHTDILAELRSADSPETYRHDAAHRPAGPRSENPARRRIESH